MRHFKFLLAAFALMLTTSTFANFDSSYEEARKGSISYEIQKMLKDSNLVIEDNFTVTVTFTVNEEKKITIQRIDSPDEVVNEFLMTRLANQKLHASFWDTGKIYELPVKVLSKR